MPIDECIMAVFCCRDTWMHRLPRLVLSASGAVLRAEWTAQGSPWKASGQALGATRLNRSGGMFVSLGSPGFLGAGHGVPVCVTPPTCGRSSKHAMSHWPSSSDLMMRQSLLWRAYPSRSVIGRAPSAAPGCVTSPRWATVPPPRNIPGACTGLSCSVGRES